MQAEGKCNAFLWEPTLFFAQYWRDAGIEATQRIGKVHKKIEVLKMQKNQQSVKPETPPRPNPFAGLDSPDDKKASVLLEELRGCYDARCWNACGILLRIATERALDAVEPACKRKRGLSNKLAYCSGNSQAFGQSFRDGLKELNACKITGDIVAHDSAIVIDQPDVDLAAQYFRHLMKQWRLTNR